MRNSTLVIAITAMAVFTFVSDYATAQSLPFHIQRSVTTLDEQPLFPGCEMRSATDREKLRCSEEKLEKYIQENLKYPAVAKEKDFIPKVVWIAATIEYNGRIHSPKIVQPGITDYDDSAQGVFVQMMRSNIKWTPGVALGKAVRSEVKIAVHYTWEGRAKAFPADSYSNEIYKIVDKVPSFPSCQQKGKKDEEILDCVSKSVNEFFISNMVYPSYALDAGMEGGVEVEYVVGKDSLVHNIRVINDIGLSHSGEINRLFNLMNEKKVAWIPGEENGDRVSVLMKTTVPFKIRDKSRPTGTTTEISPKAFFITGTAGFEEFMSIYLKRPEGRDISPCAFGVVRLKFKINGQTGEATITETTDYNNLGPKFQAAAATFLESTNGLWNTDYPNLSEKTEYSLLVPFPSYSPACENVPLGYKEVLYQSLEAAALTDNEATFQQGMDQLDKSVRLYPTDNKIRLLRGMALYKNGHRVEGCVDLKFVNKSNGDIEVPKSCKN